MQSFIELAYLAAAVLFILGMKRLQSPATARTGNRLAAIGMLIAVAVTLLLQRILSPLEMIGGFVVGAAVGMLLARRVAMTSMPELVAVFNGFGGLASALVAGGEIARYLSMEAGGGVVTLSGPVHGGAGAARRTGGDHGNAVYSDRHDHVFGKFYRVRQAGRAPER